MPRVQGDQETRVPAAITSQPDTELAPKALQRSNSMSTRSQRKDTSSDVEASFMRFAAVVPASTATLSSSLV